MNMKVLKTVLLKVMNPQAIQTDANGGQNGNLANRPDLQQRHQFMMIAKLVSLLSSALSPHIEISWLIN